MEKGILSRHHPHRTAITVLLVCFSILTLSSIWMLYYAHQIELIRYTNVTLYSYESQGTFDYVTVLKPNTIYNKTTLEPGEGPIFTRIAEEIILDFNYTFQGTKPANLTVYYGADAYLETVASRKKIWEIEQETINTTGTNIEFSISDIPPINISSVENLVKKITEETGMNIIKYNFTINVPLNIQADAAEGSIAESFSPQLGIRFESSFSTGDVIIIEGLEHTKSGDITKTNATYQTWVHTQRNISYALSILSVPGLLGTIWAYQKTKPPKLKRPEALIEEIIDPFIDIVSEADKPQTEAHSTMIPMKTWEDLAKVADTLSKPIIHTRATQNNHVFYVIDGTTRYEYIMDETTLIKKNKEDVE